jgi:hypothetical protein
VIASAYWAATRSSAGRSASATRPAAASSGRPAQGGAPSHRVASEKGVQITCSIRVAPGDQHDQPVEAERGAARVRHPGERAQKVLVQGVALAMNPFLLVHLGREPASLLARIGQFAKGVGEFHTAQIELEPLGDPGIVRRRTRQGGFGRRVFVQDRGAAKPEPGFDALDQDPADHIGPGVVGRNPDAGFVGSVRQWLPVDASVGVDRGQEIDPGMTRERLRDRDPLRPRKRVGGSGAKPAFPHACDLRAVPRWRRNPASAFRRAHPRDPFQLVNSGWCSALRSRWRNTRAKSKCAAHPPRAVFLQANSGEVWRKSGLRCPPIPITSVGKGVQMRLVAGQNLQNAGLDLGEALPSNRSRNPALTALRVASSGRRSA